MVWWCSMWGGGPSRTMDTTPWPCNQFSMGFFLTDPETRQLWLIAVGRAQLSGRQKGLQDDCPCLCVGNGDYQPCILYQFSMQKFEEEMESNFDSTEFPQITSYKDLTGEQKLLCARSWYLLHFFPDTNGSLCSTLENVLEACYYDFQLDWFFMMRYPPVIYLLFSW